MEQLKKEHDSATRDTRSFFFLHVYPLSYGAKATMHTNRGGQGYFGRETTSNATTYNKNLYKGDD